MPALVYYGKKHGIISYDWYETDAEAEAKRVSKLESVASFESLLVTESSYDEVNKQLGFS